jgi:hypothetical protein
VNQLEVERLVQDLVSQFPDLFGALNSEKTIQFTKYIQSDNAAYEEIRHANEIASRMELRNWLSEFV